MNLQMARRALAWIAVTLFPLLSAGTSQAGDATLVSYQKARGIFDECRAALGGNALSGFENMRFSYAGSAWGRGQSANPDADYDEHALHGRFVFDSVGRVYQEHEVTFRGGRTFEFQRAWSVDGGWMYRNREQQLTELTKQDAAILKSLPAYYPYRYMPNNLVAAAAQNAAGLRYVGDLKIGRRAAHQISIVDGDGVTVTLTIDAATHLPVQSHYLGGDLVLGDTTFETHYDEYRDVGGFQIPHRISFFVGGERTGEWTLGDVAVNGTLEDEQFERPTGIPVTEYTPRWKPQPVGEGVYAIRLYSGAGFSYNTMLVVFDEYVAVVEAPLSDLLYPVVANIAGKVAPGKPIRYVIPTHYHTDHTGGIKAFMATGATVVAAPQTTAFARRIAEVTLTLKPNPLTRSAAKPTFETFAKKHTISDGTQTLELYNIGPTSHVDEITVAYLPRARVLFVSDLFSSFESGFPGPPTTAIKDLARRLQELGIEVDTFVTGHGPVSTKEDFERALSGS